jgi:hypothetical protein
VHLAFHLQQAWRRGCCFAKRIDLFNPCFVEMVLIRLSQSRSLAQQGFGQDRRRHSTCSAGDDVNLNQVFRRCIFIVLGECFQYLIGVARLVTTERYSTAYEYCKFLDHGLDGFQHTYYRQHDEDHQEKIIERAVAFSRLSLRVNIAFWIFIIPFFVALGMK